jgi:hypothetical protein
MLRKWAAWEMGGFFMHWMYVPRLFIGAAGINKGKAYEKAWFTRGQEKTSPADFLHTL